jgi:hypothetical protein
MKVNGQLYPRQKNCQYSMDKRLGGPRAGLDMVVRRKNPRPCQESNPYCPACSLVNILIELLQLPKILFPGKYGSLFN